MHIFPPNINSSHRADLPEEILVILPELEAGFLSGHQENCGLASLQHVNFKFTPEAVMGTLNQAQTHSQIEIFLSL
jgi:hypothetical protein